MSTHPISLAHTLTGMSDWSTVQPLDQDPVGFLENGIPETAALES